MHAPERTNDARRHRTGGVGKTPSAAPAVPAADAAPAGAARGRNCLFCRYRRAAGEAQHAS